MTNGKLDVLIIFLHYHTGGATTSLLNFVKALDLNKYNVDLLFYEYDGQADMEIPKGVNILSQAKIHRKYGIKNVLFKTLYPPYMLSKLRAEYIRKVKKQEKRSIQMMSKQGCRYSRRLDKKYDVAVSYELTWPFNYTAKYVKADKKILWLHLDYDKSGYDYKIDRKNMKSFDRIVAVSKECMNNFERLHPELADKLRYMPNLMTSEPVRKRAEEAVTLPFNAEKDTLIFVTVCRIDFPHKGIDRGIEAFRKLKEEGMLKDVKWIIVGDGPDSKRMEDSIADNELGDYIYTVGEKKNPMPYMKKGDIFFLPSRFEGKPMAVTEAQMVGAVPAVARFASAGEQISNGEDGFIFDNNDDAIYSGLKYIIQNRDILKKMKHTVINRNYGNEYEIAVFDSIIDELYAQGRSDGVGKGSEYRDNK